jgi:hypothetical protein
MGSESRGNSWRRICCIGDLSSCVWIYTAIIPLCIILSFTLLFMACYPHMTVTKHHLRLRPSRACYRWALLCGCSYNSRLSAVVLYRHVTNVSVGSLRKIRTSFSADRFTCAIRLPHSRCTTTTYDRRGRTRMFAWQFTVIYCPIMLLFCVGKKSNWRSLMANDLRVSKLCI